MSRVVRIKGTLKIENMQIAQDAIKCFGYNGIKIENNQFVFSQYDYFDGINKNKEISDVENKYKELLRNYYEQIAQEKLNAELARLEEIRLIEEERLRVEEEKKVAREEKKNLIIENAKKQGYRVKKEITKNNTIKLVLQKRVY